MVSHHPNLTKPYLISLTIQRGVCRLLMTSPVNPGSYIGITP